MALSGSITKTIRTGYALQIAWVIVSQNVAGNTSSVTARVQLVSAGSSYTINSSATKSGSLTIDGSTYSFTFSAALAGNQTKTIFTKTVTVAHFVDGNKTANFSTSCGIAVTLGGTYYGTVTASGSGVFDTIARASDFTITTPTVEITGGNAVTITIARASPSFTHTMRVAFAGFTRDVTGLTTTGSFTIFSSWLAGMPNATSGTASVTLTTFSGTAKVGNSVTKTFRVTVPATVVPTISTVSIAEAVAGLAAKFAAYVQGKSRLAISVTAAGVSGSTIKSYRTTVQGVTYTSAGFTSEVLTASGSLPIAITVTDSRGRTATASRTATVTAYAPPTISRFSAFRSTSGGVEDSEGTYARINTEFSIAAVGSRNDSSYRFEYRLKGASSWTSLRNGTGYSYNGGFTSGSVFGADAAHEVRVTIADYFDSASRVIEIPTAFTLLDFNASGRGIAFGKVSQRIASAEFAMDVYDRFDTRIANGLAAYGSINADTTTEETFLASISALGAMYFVTQTFYSTKTATSNRVQVAQPYAYQSGSSMVGHTRSAYRRNYFAGLGWSPWMQTPVITDAGARGIWTWRRYSDGIVECFGRFNISNASISAAMGGWYRSNTFTTATEYVYPVTFSAPPALEMLFQTTNSNGALIWAFSNSADNARLYLPQFYIIKPTSTTGVNGFISIFARGT